VCTDRPIISGAKADIFGLEFLKVVLDYPLRLKLRRGKSTWQSSKVFKSDDEQIRVLTRSYDSARKLELYVPSETPLRLQFCSVKTATRVVLSKPRLQMTRDPAIPNRFITLADKLIHIEEVWHVLACQP
jgi:hypothetical protein